jgi:DNA-binding transcriptional MerR regulator/sulfur transfer complex TusBCD TusB component (DsrH family)
MTIGDFARAAGLTPKALRLYDEMGLVRPAEVDEYSGYRYYREDQLDRARLVARLRVVGMPLDRIRLLADLPAGARAAELTSYWRQVEADTSSRRSMVAALVDSLRTEESEMTLTETAQPAVAWRTGTGARDSQLDALITGSRVFAVADGFGDDRDVAARALAEFSVLEGTSGVVDPLRLLDETVRTASGSVAAPGSGCTLTALVLGDTDVAVAHVGDSRAYLVRDGRLTRLTRDHTDVQSLVDEGRLTDDEARLHEHRAQLNRALVAGRAVSPDISLHATRPGDRFVLTTDGVHAVLRTDVLASLLLDGGAPRDVVARTEDAVLAAGSPDNYAVVVVDLPADGLSRGRG